MPKWHQVGRAPDTHQPHARPSPLACRALGRRLCPFFRVWAQSLGLWGCVFTCQRMNTGDAWLAQSGLRIPSECPHTGDTRQPQSDNPGAGLGKVSRWQPGVAWQEMGKGKPESPVMSWPVQSHGRSKDEVRRSRAHPWEWRTLGIHLLGRASERLGRGVWLTVGSVRNHTDACQGGGGTTAACH